MQSVRGSVATPVSNLLLYTISIQCTVRERAKKQFKTGNWNSQKSWRNGNPNWHGKIKIEQKKEYRKVYVQRSFSLPFLTVRWG